jgi:cell division septation protein DedD
MTRWLVVVLLAANLGFMAWMYQRLASEAPPPAAAGNAPSGDTELRLLSEIPAGPAPEAEEVAAPASAPATDATDVADSNAGTDSSDGINGNSGTDSSDDADAMADASSQEPVATTAPDFVALVPGPWVGSEAPAGEGSEPPAWLALEQLAVAGPEIDRPVEEAPSVAGLAEAPVEEAQSLADQAEPPVEAAPTAEEPVVAETAEPTAAAVADTCLTLGPLAQEASAKALLDWLVRHGGTAVTRPEVTGRPDAHWLYVGPFPDLTTARLESDRLRDLGVPDHLAVRHNELGPVVSLGLYASREGRERRVQMLRAAGVEPVVVPRGPREVRWWVDARLPPQSGLTAEAITAAAEGSGEVRASACAAATGTAEAPEAPLTIGALPPAAPE